MCDTFVLIDEGGTWFGKNSDRPPFESRRTEHHPAVDGPEVCRTTYLEVCVPAARLETIISRPDWMWGAEMGVNANGVAIGNEAVFTRFVDRRQNRLLGMDLLRLALEQATSASDGVDTIVDYLQRYGQGGSAHPKKPGFRYDNSFLIADPSSAWVLETAGKWWAAKRVERFAAISNDLTLSTEFDRGADGMQDFARSQGYVRSGEFSFRDAFGRRFMPWAAKAGQRRSCSLRHLNRLVQGQATTAFGSFLPLLREHQQGERAGSNADVCMHARGFWRPSQTTASMVAHLTPEARPRVLATGSALPCLSVFKPVSWGDDDFLSQHPQFWESWQDLLRNRRCQSILKEQQRRHEPSILGAFENQRCADAQQHVSDWWTGIGDWNQRPIDLRN